MKYNVWPALLSQAALAMIIPSEWSPLVCLWGLELVRPAQCTADHAEEILAFAAVYLGRQRIGVRWHG